MKKNSKKETIKNKPETKFKKTHPKIVITALVALCFIILAIFTHWIFIFPAVFLWWMNKRYIKKHFDV